MKVMHQLRLVSDFEVTELVFGLIRIKAST